jgi:hypothetical protein
MPRADQRRHLHRKVVREAGDVSAAVHHITDEDARDIAGQRLEHRHDDLVRVCGREDFGDAGRWLVLHTLDGGEARLAPGKVRVPLGGRILAPTSFGRRVGVIPPAPRAAAPAARIPDREGAEAPG